MGAAKRLYDNNYDQRQETVSSAMAYLDNKLPEQNDNEEKQLTKTQITSNVICNLFSIAGGIIYCGLILLIIIFPLLKETEIHKEKVSFSDYKNEISRLNKEISDVDAKFAMQVQLANIEKSARKLGLVRSGDIHIESIYSDKYFVLKNKLDEFDFDDINLDDVADME